MKDDIKMKEFFEELNIVEGIINYLIIEVSLRV